MKNLKSRIVLLLFVMAGCATSKITSSWKADNTVPKSYNKILVMGLIREADRSIRENMENHLVSDLKELGFNAVSSLQEYGPKAFSGLDEEAAINKIKSNGVDAVLTIVLLDKEKERKYIAGHIYYSPYGYYYNHFWGYYGTMHRRIYETGYYITDTKYFWESNFYDMSTQKLIYSVQTQSFDPANSESLGHQYGQMIVKDMVKSNIINKTTETPAKAF
ncbi:MAG TPA: hypothetical protein VJ765_03255 [Chitinophagaceae bacterium]|nr:hypothetical protein [Chitinophagaceae bacterium]